MRSRAPSPTSRVGTYSGEPLRFKALDTLQLAPAEGLIPTEGDTDFSFTLTGTATLVWKVDTAKIATAVAGKNRETAENMLQTLPEVDRRTPGPEALLEEDIPGRPGQNRCHGRRGRDPQAVAGEWPATTS